MTSTSRLDDFSVSASGSPRPSQEGEGPRLSSVEFIALMAAVISVGALSIDAMLPAVAQIAGDLHAPGENSAQLVVSVMFLGFSLGQLFYGPFSDAVGRKPAIYFGLSLFIVGCLLSTFAESFTQMIVGRALAGLGAAAPRIVTMALIRDQYEGRQMAKVMSLIMAIFVLVPAIAPSLGQWILRLSSWRAIFILLSVQALACLVWFGVRQKETLLPEDRQAFSLRRLGHSLKLIFRVRATLGYTLIFGCVFANFIGYLTSAPQFFSDLWDEGERFPLYFAALALCIGAASIVNSRLVMRFGMRKIVALALFVVTGSALAFSALLLLSAQAPSLALTMPVLMVIFFSTGLLLGNLNALAMEPVAHVAGTAAAAIGALSMFIALLLGSWVGMSYDGTLQPLFLGFAGFGTVALLIFKWVNASCN